MKKIGIMGGTFDPIHNGHLSIGKQAYLEYHLDEVWFMPSGHPPHKKDHFVTDAVHRCAMTKLAITDYPYFQFSDFEVKRAGNTYTAKTLSLLTSYYPDSQFFFIIGADSLFEIENWFHPEEIMKQAVLLVAGREYAKASRTMAEQIEYLKETYHGTIYRLHSEEMDISSAEIRKLIQEGKSPSPYLSQAVEAYICANRLYGARKDEYHE